MSDLASPVKREIEKHANAEKADFLTRFFRAYPGGYGEGDCFLGVVVPTQRKIARRFYRELDLSTIEELLRDKYHECRLTALLMLVERFSKAKESSEQEKIVNVYIKNLGYVNNWDLVDSSADKILGAFLEDKSKDILYTLVDANHLWRKRVAILATLHFIRQGDFEHTLRIAKRLVDHPHDLIHKAVGWMLREIGKRDLNAELQFLYEHYHIMPRTMLRYAIERFDPDLRSKFLAGEI